MDTDSKRRVAMSSNVVILSNSLDFHADEVERVLLKRGANVFRLNTDRFSADDVRLVFKESGGSSLSIGERTLPFNSVASVLYRRPESLEVNVQDEHQREFAEKEAGEFFNQLYFGLDVFWVSKYQALEFARRKLPQLNIARSLGMSTPLTLITNSPDEVRDFFRHCRGNIIYKTLKSPVIKPGDGPELWGVPTTRLTSEHLDYIDLVRSTGGIFQEYVDKLYEVRVTVIGREVFAAQIDSQTVPEASVDWREAVDFQKVKVEAYELPELVANQCVSIVEAYGLEFGAIDLVRTPSGRYVFLEINCNGQWLWVEELTGQKLLESMVRLLMLEHPYQGKEVI